MFVELSLAMLLHCAPTVITNRTDEPWGTAADKQTESSAKTRCAILYENAPCVMEIIKKPENTYNVICGADRK